VRHNLRLGISACLLGRRVRYDGGHKLDRLLRDGWGGHVEFLPVCPEADCGLGVPREPMVLVGDPGLPRLTGLGTRRDRTGLMLAWVRRRVRELAREDLSGFVFRCKSPSCALGSVPIYGEKGVRAKRSSGLFAQAFVARLPLVPAAEETELQRPGGREHFLEQVFTLRRWRSLLTRRKSGRALAAFHARHELLLRAHAPRLAGALVDCACGPGPARPAERYAAYGGLLRRALALHVTVPKHVAVLRRALRATQAHLSPDERRKLGEAIEGYRRGTTPLSAPVNLLRCYAERAGLAELADQWYLSPDPTEMLLRRERTRRGRHAG